MPNAVRVVAIVPVRSLTGAKSRLGDSLDAEERQDLVLGLLRRTVAAARAARSVSSVLVVSEDEALLRCAAEAGATTLLQTGDGLNQGLEEARASVSDADAVLVLPVDLPAVSGPEIERIVDAAVLPRACVVVLVVDRGGTGTNALLLSPPRAIPFRFGEGSREGHREEARRAAAEYRELESPLSFDLDTPEDLLQADIAGLGHEAGR